MYSLIFLFILISPLSCKYTLIWSDEFNSKTLNLSDWNIEEGDDYYNNETQAYTPQNYFISQGSLFLEAREESSGSKSYTSARINTQFKRDFLYGKFEARMKMPKGPGFWPAFWMLPSNKDDWPRYGEIDIVETLGDDIFTLYGTCHMGEIGLSINNGTGFGGSFQITMSYSEDFHVYAVEWEKGDIRWLFDGQEYFRAKPQDTKPYWPFDGGQKFFLILNLAVGGNWPGNVDGSTIFPAKLEIDYIRVYQNKIEINRNGTGNPNNSKGNLTGIEKKNNSKVTNGTLNVSKSYSKALYYRGIIFVLTVAIEIVFLI